MSGRLRMIQEDMENLGPLKAADVKEAQQNIIRKIRLRSSGRYCFKCR